MRAHIVLAHPESASFNGSLADRAVAHFKSVGAEVTKSDLYAMGFDPVESADHYDPRANTEAFIPLVEQRQAWTNGTTPSAVIDELEKLQRADLLVLQFPLWWHGPPAMLKGWFDRTFPSGGVYTSRRRYDAGFFRGKRALLSVTTGAPEAAFGPGARGGDLRTMLWPIEYSLHYLGFTVLEPFLSYGVQGHGYSYEDQRQTERRLARKLEGFEDRLGNIERESGRDFPGWSDWDGLGRPIKDSM